jgi:enolase
MIDYLVSIAEKYPLISLEDGLAQDEWDAWTELTTRLSRLQIVGDDLLVTNPIRLQKAIDTHAGNAILIKPNQIGTLSETIYTIQLAKENGWRTIVSHRSGDQIKTGSLSRSERNAKHNEIMRIESIDKSLHIADPFS